MRGKTIWIIFYYFSMVLAVVVNVIIFYNILIRKNGKNKLINSLVFNLCCINTSQLLCNILQIIYTYDSMFDEFCPIHKFVQNWHMVASIYTAMFIAIERYKAVTIPMHQWLSKNKILSFNLALWIISIISSLPTFWFSRKMKLDLIVVHSVCINDPEKIDRWFAVCCAWTTLVFSVPICIMIFCYFRIRAKQKELLCIGEMNDTQIRKLQRRKKVTKRYTIISVIFLISWLPNFIWLTLRLSLPSDIIDSYWKNYFENIMRVIKWFSVTCSLNSVYFHYYFSANFKDNFIDCRPFYERKYKTFKSALNESE